MKKPKLTLSAAILEGIPLVPETKHMTFRFDATGREWVRRTAHTKPLLGADALGTALVGLAGSADYAVERAFADIDRTPMQILFDLYPELTVQRMQCPVCARRPGWAPGRPPLILVGLLRHLQDDHDYNREKVANFLGGLQ